MAERDSFIFNRFYRTAIIFFKYIPFKSCYSMKPNINRMTYCIGCRRPKMLFEEKKKADNFIRFNKDEIFEENGKAPVRSYYCAFCS